MKRKLVSIFGIFIAGALGICACGSSAKYDTTAESAAYNGSYSDYGYNDYSNYEEADYDSFGSSSSAESVSDSGATSAKKTNRKLIKNVSISVETKEFDNLLSTLDSQVNEFDGYVEYSYINNGSKYNSYTSTRSATYTIRIPQEKLDSFLEAFSGLCNVVNKNESVEDITLTYVDLESHKEALKAEQERLLALLDEAYSLEDILTIESRLTDIRYQIESMESQLRTYDNKVTYSTVSLSIDEVKELTIVEPEPETFWDRVSSGFTNSIVSVGEGFTNFAVWFITALPHLVIWGLIIFGIVMLIRAIVKATKKKNKIRREKEAQEAAKRAASMPVAPFPYGQPGGMPQQVPGQMMPPVTPASNVQPVNPAQPVATAQSENGNANK